MTFPPLALLTPVVGSAALAVVHLLKGELGPGQTQRPSPPTSVLEECASTNLPACHTESGGFLRGPGGKRIYWQVQSIPYQPAQAVGREAAYVLFDEEGNVIARSNGALSYSPPILFWFRSAAYIAVPGTYAGWENANADTLYRWDSGSSLVQIENDSWRQELPPWLTITGGVIFNYHDDVLSADTYSWRSRDPRCCPTGGQVRISFEIEDGRLAAQDIYPTP